MKALLKATNLAYQFPQKTLFQNFSLSVHAGEWVVFIGNNGSGKSTLLKVLSGFTPAQTGHVEWKEGLKKAYVGQHEFTVHDRFPATALELVLSAYTADLGFFKRVTPQQKSQAIDMLTQLGLKDEIHTRLSHLSGGQRQRVFIAKALLTKPDILFLDEPTSALDPVFTLDLFKRLKQIQNEGLAIVMVTHDLALAQTVSQTILCVEEHTILHLDLATITDELAHRHSHVGVHHV